MEKNTLQLIENGLVIATTSFEISDFAPIVVINEDKEGEIAMWHTETCSLSKKETLTLSNDYDEDLRKYIIPEIVVAKNSTSKIPLKVLQGYDPWGSQDDDGIVEFSCSNENVIISIEGVDNKTKHEKEVEYGDEIVIAISFKKKLNRGDKFAVDIKGKDGTNIEIAGKLNFTIIEADVFTESEFQKALDENDSLRRFNIWNNLWGTADKVCFRVADKQFSKIVENDDLVLKSYYKKTGYTRMEKYSKAGYIKNTKRFEQTDTWIRGTHNGLDLYPKSFKKGKEKVFTTYIGKEIKNKIGYHIFYYVLLNGHHVLMILVDNSDPCACRFKILDQLKDRDWNNFENLDTDLLEMTQNNYANACKNTKSKKDHNSSLQLWKLKRKF